MTARAAGGDAGVIHAATDEGGRAGVASFARSRGGDMGRWLTLRCGPVVTTGAAGGDAGMGPAHRQERERVPMTALAPRRACDVRRRLAACLCSIVTTRTGADGLAVVVANLLPSRFHMASLACIGRTDVRARFARCDRAIVAAGALPWRAFEATADVTRRAIDAEMSSC